jgi:hypothetical protein
LTLGKKYKDLNILEMNLKTLLASICLSIVLAGCAASSYNGARSSANLVTNGMTIAQAVQIIGMPPTHQTTTDLTWTRGTAQTYDATSGGAIRFHVKDGMIVGVPQGGIFSAEARRLFLAEWAAEQDRKSATALQEYEAAAKEAAEAAAKRSAALAADAEKNRARQAALAAERDAEILEEQKAAAGAKIVCNVKTSCGKVFALAQIYIATETDQKIQVVTDSVIQTYNPTEVGNVGASIIKMPQRGDNAEVSLSLSCKNSEFDSAGSLCRIKKTKLYKGFRPFIQSRLVS